MSSHTDTTDNEYVQQANAFLASINATFTATFLRSGAMWDEDQVRDIYAMSIKRADRPAPLTVEFGQSLAKSVDFMNKQCDCRVKYRESSVHESECRSRINGVSAVVMRNKGLLAPTAHDMLTSIQRSDPGTFADFCSEFGCGTDNRKALDLYLRVQEEWSKVRGFFSAEELERLQEIQ